MFKLLQPTEIKCSMAMRTETVCSQTNVLTDVGSLYAGTNISQLLILSH